MSSQTLETRFRIHISEYAKFIIRSDIQSFNLPVKSSIDSFINELLIKYYRYAKCSSFYKSSVRERIINSPALSKHQTGKDKLYSDADVEKIIAAAEELSRTQTKLQTLLENLGVKDIEEILSEISERKEKHTHIVSPVKTKKSAHPFRPSTAVLKHFEKADLTYEVLIPDYVDSIIEEYVNLSYDDRERIFFRETFETIENAIENKKGLNIRSNGNKYHVLPYTILKSSPNVYSYLICLASEADKKEYSIKSFRISYILEKVEEYTLDDRTLNSEDIVLLNTAIEKKGIQFLTGKTREFEIKLTPAGVKKYNNRVHIRPNYSHIEDCDDGCKLYKFNCSEQQVEAYFFKFGVDALIIKPTSMQNLFRKNYEKAFNLYEKIKEQ